MYTKPFNTLITRQLITAILKGEFTDPVALPGFIDRFPAAGR
jgi:hypothetical protein